MNPPQRKTTKPQKSGGIKSAKSTTRRSRVSNAVQSGQPLPLLKKKPSPSHMGSSSGRIRSGQSTITVGSRGHLGQSLRVAGTEYLGAVIVGGDTDITDGVFLNRQNVAGPTATRLAQFSEIYERWHAIKYTYRFTSSQPTTTAGTVIMAQEPDPTVNYTNGASGNIARWRTLPGSVMFQSWQNASCTLPTSADYTSLWTADTDSKSVNPDDRLDMAGRVWIGCVAATGLEAGSVLGILELDYSIEFYSPKLSMAVTERAAEWVFNKTRFDTIFPNSGQAGIFDNIIGFIKTAASSVVSTALNAAIKAYLRLEEAPGSGINYTPGEAGFTPGIYTLTVTHCTNTEKKIVSDFPFQTLSTVATGVQFRDDYSTTNEPSRHYYHHAPDGTGFLFAYRYSITFGVDKQRGMADLAVSVTDNTKFGSGDYLIFSIKTAGSPVYASFLTRTPKMVSKTTKEHKEESKGEQKFSQSLPPSPHHDDDVTWSFPSKSLPLPSSLPTPLRVSESVQTTPTDRSRQLKVSSLK